ncbi:hypothetical protein BDF14DRAFT_1800794 [Spinellus fusiger]|nr:hypothetical protein BDF14DRAFT_1800794 [Spinellus fusiger]
MDRIHRLGQHRPIKITRLIIENSIESRIVQLQEKKQALVESTIGKLIRSHGEVLHDKAADKSIWQAKTSQLWKDSVLKI